MSPQASRSPASPCPSEYSCAATMSLGSIEAESAWFKLLSPIMLAAREELEVGLEVKIMPAPASLMARIVHRNAHAFPCMCESRASAFAACAEHAKVPRKIQISYNCTSRLNECTTSTTIQLLHMRINLYMCSNLNPVTDRHYGQHRQTPGQTAVKRTVESVESLV